jgi:hypothetical protein
VDGTASLVASRTADSSPGAVVTGAVWLSDREDGRVSLVEDP